ncbi:DEAD/DEAH box helicase [Patescibacteria group bacterium]|nr:DEAD/DEAH box helicase [Patescibacteria group bacterium]
MLFDEALLRTAVEPELFLRGKTYFLDRSVEGVTVRRAKNDDILITGRVIGSENYEVTLRLSPKADRVAFFDCTCPFDWGMCKHVIALGMEALSYDLEKNTLPSSKERVSQVLGAYAKRSGVAMTEEEINDLAGSLDQDARKVQRQSRTERHSLDQVIARISYDRRHDFLSIQGIARYGKYDFPLGDTTLPDRYEQVVDDRLEVDVVMRLEAAEEDAISDISDAIGAERDATTNNWIIPSAKLLEFVRVGLEELRERVTVEMDDTAKPIFEIDTIDVEADVSFRQSTGVDWFSFSVDWHCKQANVDKKMLEKALGASEPYVRLADGRFARIGNGAELRPMLDWMKTTEEEDAAGTHRTRLFHVPELLFLVQSTRHTHLEGVEKSLDRFMDDVKRGALGETIELSPKLEQVLRPYQKDGVAWLAFLQRYGFGGVLADEMGLGKTIQTLAFLWMLRKNKTPESSAPTLVICPKTLLSVWQQEVQTYTPDARVLVVDGTPPERKAKIQTLHEHDIILTSYSLMQRDLPLYLDAKVIFSACVLDEAHFIKNAVTQTALTMKAIPSRFRLALTGTPLENGVHELWSVFDFLMPGFFGTARSFTAQFSRPIRERNDQQALDKLRRKLKPFMLRRTKEMMASELPPKIEQEITCRLSPEQLVLYTRTLEQIRSDVTRLVEEQGFERSKIEILAALTKLRRVCDHPSFLDPRLPGDPALSGKLEGVLEFIYEALRGDHKVLVFSQFTTMLDLVRNALSKENIETATIEGSTKDRALEIRKFRSSVNVFLLSLKAGGTGLTLTEADTVLLIDPWWNPQAEKQAMDRAHRIGQTKTVNVYKFVAKETIEEKMLELQKKKQGVFDAIMQDATQSIESLTWEDVKGLLA